MADIEPVFRDCNEVAEYICTNFGEEKDSPRCVALQEHLAQCPDCSKYCNSIEKMIGLYRATSPGFSDNAKNMLLHSLGVSDA